MKKVTLLEDSDWLHGEAEVKKKKAFVALIRKFQFIYKIISSISPTEAEKENLFERKRSWVRTFVGLGRFLEGFNKRHVTPYMHILVYHLAKLIIDLGNIKYFNGKGVEKSNDYIKLIYHRKSNTNAATVDALRLLTRFYVRIKRKDIKRQSQFWDTRKRRVQRNEIEK